MSEPEEYRRVREKVIGMTFQMQQQEDEAVDIFIGQTTDTDVRQFLADNREIVLSIFQQSQTHNLRILKQTIWAWDRFYTYIRSDHRDRQKGMIAAFKLFVALSIEVRSGRISADDLTDRVEKVVAGQRARRDDESS